MLLKAIARIHGVTFFPVPCSPPPGHGRYPRLLYRSPQGGFDVVNGKERRVRRDRAEHGQTNRGPSGKDASPVLLASTIACARHITSLCCCCSHSSNSRYAVTVLFVVS